MFELPGNLGRAVAEPGSDNAALRAWVATLPRTVSDIAARWSLDLGAVFQPGGVASWVAPARRRSDERVVLKVAWSHEESLHEVDALALWAGHGAVRLIQAEVLGTTTAMLLERCDPGTALAQVLPPPGQDQVLADLLRRLWRPPPVGFRFRPLEQMCDAWVAQFPRRMAERTGAGPLLDPGLVRAGTDLFRRLPRTGRRQVVLCTDLHSGNVLAAAREPWLAIDPKPYVGDPTYDPLQHMINSPDRLTTDANGFVQRMADLLQLDADRLRLWLFARCVVALPDRPDLLRATVRLAPGD